MSDLKVEVKNGRTFVRGHFDQDNIVDKAEITFLPAERSVKDNSNAKIDELHVRYSGTVTIKFYMSASKDFSRSENYLVEWSRTDCDGCKGPIHIYQDHYISLPQNNKVKVRVDPQSYKEPTGLARWYANSRVTFNVFPVVEK